MNNANEEGLCQSSWGLLIKTTLY